MTTFAILSVLVSLAAVLGLLSHRVLRLPATIGTMAMALACSIALLFLGRHTPLQHWALSLEQHIDFNAVVLHGMLAFLLFGGSLHLDLEQLRREKLSIFLLSVVSTLLSTLLVGAGLKWALQVAGVPLSWLECLLFGALISPTDPVAVLEMLQRVDTPPALRAQLAGESLFNDGIGAVLFLALLSASSGGHLPSLGRFSAMLLLEAGGGIGLGLLLGYGIYRLLPIAQDYRLEILLTLALAMGGYAAADVLGLSAPLEAVAAGLMVNGRIRELAMAREKRRHLDQFWGLVEDIMNAVLFLLLGLELLVISFPLRWIVLGMVMIVVVLAVRFVTVASVVVPMRWLREPVAGTLPILTWGGLRGGLSVALALSLNHGPGRDLLLTLTYIIVVVSILGQGMTLHKFVPASWLGPSREGTKYATAPQAKKLKAR